MTNKILCIPEAVQKKDSILGCCPRLAVHVGTQIKGGEWPRHEWSRVGERTGDIANLALMAIG